MPQPLPDRYSDMEMDGEIVIYDRAEPDAWIQSSAALPILEAR